VDGARELGHGLRQLRHCVCQIFDPWSSLTPLARLA
jgi:hypothetical protein